MYKKNYFISICIVAFNSTMHYHRQAAGVGMFDNICPHCWCPVGQDFDKALGAFAKALPKGKERKLLKKIDTQWMNYHVTWPWDLSENKNLKKEYILLGKNTDTETFELLKKPASHVRKEMFRDGDIFWDKKRNVVEFAGYGYEHIECFNHRHDPAFQKWAKTIKSLMYQYTHVRWISTIVALFDGVVRDNYEEEEFHDDFKGAFSKALSKGLDVSIERVKWVKALLEGHPWRQRSENNMPPTLDTLKVEERFKREKSVRPLEPEQSIDLKNPLSREVVENGLKELVKVIPSYLKQMQKWNVNHDQFLIKICYHDGDAMLFHNVKSVNYEWNKSASEILKEVPRNAKIMYVDIFHKGEIVPWFYYNFELFMTKEDRDKVQALVTFLRKYLLDRIHAEWPKNKQLVDFNEYKSNVIDSLVSAFECLDGFKYINYVLRFANVNLGTVVKYKTNYQKSHKSFGIIVPKKPLFSWNVVPQEEVQEIKDIEDIRCILFSYIHRILGRHPVHERYDGIYDASTDVSYKFRTSKSWDVVSKQYGIVEQVNTSQQKQHKVAKYKGVEYTLHTGPLGGMFILLPNGKKHYVKLK